MHVCFPRAFFDEEKTQKQQEEAQKRREEQLKDDYKIYKDGEIKKYRETLSDEEMQQIKNVARKQVEQRMGKNKIGRKGFIDLEVKKCLAEKTTVLPFDDWLKNQQQN